MRLAFTGHIAGIGTASGLRIVVGTWDRSPFGAFTDVMLQTEDDERVLLAPDAAVAEFVSSTYEFDRLDVGEVTATLDARLLTVASEGFEARIAIGGPAPVDRLLRLVPRRLAASPRWLRAIDPVAARVIPGVHTYGTAGNDRVEYYGVQRSRRITAVDGQYRGVPLGGLAPLRPPVSFGFSSAPPSPQIVSVTTTIDVSGEAIR
ncbi:hypothetical protein DVS77_33475 [Mycolicibacterium moriokaense]|nr:hypothetical protein DVS77_33475 [Mycolicibacterium moriokaense]